MSLGARLKYAFLSKRLKQKWNYEDFLYYRMQEVPFSRIDEFASLTELTDFEKQLNSEEKRYIFNDKSEFLTRFSKYIKRDVLICKNASEQEFDNFCKKHGKVIIKPSNMYAGIGVEIYDGDAHNFEFLKNNNYVAEEYIFQAKEYAEVYDKSLNTIRVTTLIDDEGEVRILFAVNQFGSGGSVVDNDDDTGIWAAINLDTGVVFATDILKETGYVCDIHPDTGKSIIGFANPSFEVVKELAINLAKEIKECRLVGWDIAVKTDYSAEVIEGNVTPELDLYQMISGKGLAKEIKNVSSIKIM